MTTTTSPMPNDDVERFFTVLKSLNEFDKAEVMGVIQTLISPTQRDLCFTRTYYRCEGHIETLLTLKSLRNFQAIAMIARGLFELAVDVALINVVNDSVKKLFAFSQVEKLSAAKKILRFKESNPTAKVHTSTYEQFIANNEAQIRTDSAALCPSVKLKDLHHWSGMNLAQRAALLREPFDRLYAAHYPLLSLYVHSGLTGVINLESKAFRALAGICFAVTMESYMALLTAIIKEYNVSKANEKIKEKLQLARMLPFADSPEEARALQRVLLGY